MIARASIQEVQDRADIAEIIGQFIRLKKRGAGYIANCPFHNEKTPSFHVSPTKGIYKCFGCGKGGNAVTFIQEHEKLTFPEAIRWLADYYKIAIEETERSPEQIQHQQAEESLRILNDFAAVYFHDTLLHSEEGQAIGLSYFTQRGFRKEIIDRFRLGYALENGEAFYHHAIASGYPVALLEKAGLIRNRNDRYYDMYRGRVVFPIQNMTGRVLGFGARILKNNEKAPKYINTPENELYLKSKILYGMHQSRQAIARQDECLLVEGYTDVLSLHQGGVENVLASSGTSLTEDQLRVIGQLTKNLTILYDGDTAGVKAALRGLDMALAQSFNVQLVLLPDGADPDSFIQESGAARFQEYVTGHKQDVISFRLETGMRDAGRDPVRRSKLVNEIAESISKINKAEDFALQNHYIREAARRLDLEEAGFVNLVNKYIRDRVEQEQRHHARQPEQPSVVETYPDMPLPKEGLSEEEQQEWELIRVLVEHGDKPMEGSRNVADFIFQRVDPELFESATARKVYDHFFNYIAVHQQTPPLSHFTHWDDKTIQERMATLLQIHASVSPNWSLSYGIEILPVALNYTNEAESALAYFELKKIITMQEDLSVRLVHEQDPQKIAVLQKHFLELRQSENEIVRKHGTVVVRILKKMRTGG